MPQFDVFLSHNSVDKPWVIKLKDDLIRYGISVWLDKDEIRPGDLFARALEQGLANSQAVALIVSPEAMASGWVEAEYYRALSLSQNKQTALQLIPVILRQAELPGFLQDRSWIDFRDETTYVDNVWQLVWGITGQKPAEVLDLSAPEPPVNRASSTPNFLLESPYGTMVKGVIGVTVLTLVGGGVIALFTFFRSPSSPPPPLDTPTPTQTVTSTPPPDTPTPTRILTILHALTITVTNERFAESVLSITEASPAPDMIRVKGDDWVTVTIEAVDQGGNVIQPAKLTYHWELCCKDGGKNKPPDSHTSIWRLQPPTYLLTETITLRVSDENDHSITATIPFTITEYDF